MIASRFSPVSRFACLAGLLIVALTCSGCAAPRESAVAGVYDLDASAVRDLAADGIDDIEDPSQQMAMGMALSMLQSLTISLHLEPDGTAFVTGIQPAPSGTWSVDGDRVSALLGVPGDDADRAEAVLRDGTLVVPAGGGMELPFDLVFRKRPEIDPEPVVEPRDVVDPDDIQSE
jgi:hypothetical protein